MNIKYEDLQKLEYFNFSKEDLHDRFVPLFPLYNNGWEMYVNTKKGLLPLKIVDRADGFYISQNFLKQTDIKLEFFNVMLKKNNFKDNVAPINHIYDDIYNLMASIEKVNFFSNLYNSQETFKLCKYASVELESIFQNSRAIFENLQKIQNNLIKNTVSAQNDDFFTVKQVKFGTREKEILTVTEYQDEYKIPEQLAKFYVNFQEFFFFVLNMRNDIFHSRKSFNLFLGEEGFSIPLKENNLENLHFWDENNILKNGIGSLKALIAYIALTTVYALEEYAKTISSIIQLPNDILPNYNIYMRSEFNETVKELHTYVDNNAWNIKT